MTAPDKPAPTEPRPLLQLLGAVLWPSFFTAAAMSAVLFARVDPVELQRISFPALSISRELGYSLGFFAFWLGTLCACSVTALLLRPSREAPEIFE
ncbi:hypothetical protein ARC78_00015 [Stenotrophomonas pictorum JCM 9942]|uniref:Transmembrane protein n=1 Tax=Stenotrophomonas pictorum JCM 9942 TaxID=1236960 RepID=A0A0R0AUH0_9GAMM|nr:hypothetical protein [Stenotrophomonas pictorum]KRG45390.1 hypothetical protein ARC78_00015 [Stenotrophomonas pictorum JCM 9942]